MSSATKLSRNFTIPLYKTKINLDTEDTVLSDDEIIPAPPPIIKRRNTKFPSTALRPMSPTDDLIEEEIELIHEEKLIDEEK